MVQLLILSTADKNRVLLSGEHPDYIHAVAANVSNKHCEDSHSSGTLLNSSLHQITPADTLLLSQVTFISMQGYKQKKVYIIAEGPMESTTRNMWKLIYDRKCGVVVMLSDLLEDGMVSYEII